VVTNRQKRGVHVSVPLPPDVAAEVIAVMDLDGHPQYIFWNRTDGKPKAAVDRWECAFKCAFKPAGMPSGHSQPDRHSQHWPEGNPAGNWLTRAQAKELLAVPDRSTLKGKRDCVILALLVGCALRRNELAELDVETIQQREGRWVLADLEGKGRRIRTPLQLIYFDGSNGKNNEKVVPLLPGRLVLHTRRSPFSRSTS
jgi:integrase